MTNLQRRNHETGYEFSPITPSIKKMAIHTLKLLLQDFNISFTILWALGVTGISIPDKAGSLSSATNNMLKVCSRNSRKRFETSSKFTIKTAERRLFTFFIG